ncbi:Hypothetical predicted protein, partial [Pelobates cultripes]
GPLSLSSSWSWVVDPYSNCLSAHGVQMYPLAQHAPESCEGEIQLSEGIGSVLAGSFSTRGVRHYKIVPEFRMLDVATASACKVFDWVSGVRIGITPADPKGTGRDSSRTARQPH